MSGEQGDRQDLAARRHALRTPLNHILGFTELLIEELDTLQMEEIRTDLNKIHEAGHQMLQLLDEEAGANLRGPRLARPAEPSVNSEATGSILVVDDEANNRMLMTRNLTKRGYTVTEATDGKEALDLLDREDFDLILCDIMMPIVDGTQVLKEVVAAYGDALPVIIISAMDQMDLVIECLDLGAADFVQKPFEPAVLLARVRATIKRKRQREIVGAAMARRLQGSLEEST